MKHLLLATLLVFIGFGIWALMPTGDQVFTTYKIQHETFENGSVSAEIINSNVNIDDNYGFSIRVIVALNHYADYPNCQPNDFEWKLKEPDSNRVIVRSLENDEERNNDQSLNRFLFKKDSGELHNGLSGNGLPSKNYVIEIDFNNPSNCGVDDSSKHIRFLMVSKISRGSRLARWISV